MTTLKEHGRTAYEARYAGQTLGPDGPAPSWMDLGPDERRIWAQVEAAVVRDLREAVRHAVRAHDAIGVAVEAEAVDEAIEAEKHMEGAVERLRALVEGEADQEGP
ncbi:hypothetical protein [Methylobacterium oxalidis]|uniref:Uncharacterized protein n=1 Tax=Methylobacterium oxalidis TaxID=944322 RepID=A0A512JCF9_9HYPH|nr:hypothetical protein [Methylobacterium oxalidis]GEP07622.1 hypothetical protein MOX02_56600 [Methylobacterium oxalidis]GJE35644.1 hypothetical protein LDDCCGHA_5864 [Methylobacterium oxalidis]GLS65545.1 hypothetical protein GCM10007888_39270 [Methylobacterium oxalidis]